jgi:hypothetical protein
MSAVGRSTAISILAVALALSGCAVAPPAGPSVAVMPGKDKNFEAFQADDATCKQFASQQIGGVAPAQAANDIVAGSAVVGTVLGAAAGAAIGAATGNPGAGAAIGAGSGAVLGTAAGLGAAQNSSYSLQQRYDVGYMQCMSAKGNSVPQAATYPQTAYAYPPYYPSAYAYPYPYYYPGWYGPGFVRFGFGFGFHDHDHDFHRHH